MLNREQMREFQDRIENTPSGITIEGKEEFENIKNGRQTAYVDIGWPNYINFNFGDRIIFRDKGGEEAEAKVMRTSKRINSFNELIANEMINGKVKRGETINKFFPGLAEKEALDVYQNKFKPHLIEKYGLVVIEFEVAEKKWE